MNLAPIQSLSLAREERGQPLYMAPPWFSCPAVGSFASPAHHLRTLILWHHACHHLCLSPWVLLYSLKVPLKHHHWQGWANWEQQEMTSRPSHPHASFQLLVLLNNWKRRIIHSADLGSQPGTQIISEWIIHKQDNWELPKLLFVARASHGRTFNMESIDTRRGKETWLPGPDFLHGAW